MRQLAPAILFASITALMGGTALAATGATDSPSTEKITIQANTNDTQGLSYSDKSNTSPGTNARMDAPPPAARKHKAKVAKDQKDAEEGDPSMVDRQPIDATNGAAVSSTTGTSGGR